MKTIILNIGFLLLITGAAKAQYQGVCFSSLYDNSYTVESTQYSITSGDFNKDGNLDIASPNYSANSISINFGDGDGGFTFSDCKLISGLLINL